MQIDHWYPHWQLAALPALLESCKETTHHGSRCAGEQVPVSRDLAEFRRKQPTSNPSMSVRSWLSVLRLPPDDSQLVRLPPAVTGAAQLAMRLCACMPCLADHFALPGAACRRALKRACCLSKLSELKMVR